MAAWAFECLLCKTSQQSCLAPGELGESKWEAAWLGAGRTVWNRARCICLILQQAFPEPCGERNTWETWPLSPGQ